MLSFFFCFYFATNKFKISSNLDKIDLQILKNLQEDGRITNLELSSKVGLSPAPTLERVKKLEKLNIIKSFHAQLDPAKLGLGIQTFMLVTLVGHKSEAIKNFVTEINKIPEVVECYHVTGSGDHLLKIMVKDLASYEQLVMEKISTIQGMGQIQTMMILGNAKQSKVIPIEY